MTEVAINDCGDELAILDRLLVSELRDLLGDEFCELVELYLETAEVNIGRMRDAARDGDVKALRQHAHGLKGACQNIGALRLARVCASVENRARDDRAADMNSLLDQLSAEADAVRAQLTGQL